MYREARRCRHCDFAVPADAPVCPGCGRPAIEGWRKQARALDRPDRRFAPQPAAPLRNEGYRPLVTLARVGRALFVIELMALVAYAATVAAWWWAEDLRSITLAGTDIELEPRMLARAVAAALLAATIAAASVFVAWLLRAYRNLPALGIEGRRIWVGLVVLAWFIPGANLFVPKMVADDVWRASSPNAGFQGGTAWRRRPLGPAVQRWWFSWLVVPAVAVIALTVVRDEFSGFERHVGIATANGIAVIALLVSCLAARDMLAIVTIAQARRADIVVDIREGIRRAEDAHRATAERREPPLTAGQRLMLDE